MVMMIMENVSALDEMCICTTWLKASFEKVSIAFTRKSDMCASFFFYIPSIGKK